MNKSIFVKIKELFSTSIFFGFFIWFADFFYKKICRSFTAKLFSSYSLLSQKYEKSFSKKILKKIFIKKEKRLNAKNKIQKFIETSFFYKMLKTTVNVLLASRVRVYGLVLFIWGFCSVSVGVIKTFVATFVDSDFFLIYQGIALVVIAVPLLASRGNTGHLLAHGRITGYLICDLIGIKAEKIIRPPVQESTVIPALLGLVFGVSSMFVDPYVVLFLVLLLFFVILVFHKPEFGVVITVFTIPFLPTMLICAQIALVFFAYMFKVIRGKRSLKFDALDIAVLCFAFFMFLGGVASASFATSIQSVCVFVCFMMMYFLITNLIKTRVLLRKMLIMMVTAFFVCSLIGLYQNFFGVADTTWTDTDMFSDIETRVVSTFENPNVFGEYLIMMMPIGIAMFLLANGFKNKSAVAVILVSAVGALVFTWSRGAWLGLLFSLAVYLIVVNKRAISLYFIGIAALPFVIPFLPRSIIERFASIGDMTDTSTSYRVYIWEAVADMIGDYWLGGIGVGTGAFSKVYPSYALSGIESAPHSHNLYFQIFLELGVFGFISFLVVLFLSVSKCCSNLLKTRHRETRLVSTAALVGILAILVQGLTDYVWYNYRVFLFFWVIVGVMSASVNCDRADSCDETEESELLMGGQNEKTAEIEISF